MGVQPLAMALIFALGFAFSSKIFNGHRIALDKHDNHDYYTYMTNTNRDAELATAERNAAAARIAFNVAKTKTARREAAEDLEFWTNKSAFLAHAKVA